MTQVPKAMTHVLLLAAVCLPAFANIPRTQLVAEKPNLGVASFALVSHRADSAANALIAPGFSECLYDSGARSCCSGHMRDAETALDYFGARYLSSAQGRFTSTDWSAVPQPVPYANYLDPQTLNLYGYVRNNPINQVDSDGHCPACIMIFQELQPLAPAATRFLAVVGGAATGAYIGTREAVQSAVSMVLMPWQPAVPKCLAGFAWGEVMSTLSLTHLTPPPNLPRRQQGETSMRLAMFLTRK